MEKDEFFFIFVARHDANGAHMKNDRIPMTVFSVLGYILLVIKRIDARNGGVPSRSLYFG